MAYKACLLVYSSSDFMWCISIDDATDSELVKNVFIVSFHFIDFISIIGVIDHVLVRGYRNLPFAIKQHFIFHGEYSSISRGMVWGTQVVAVQGDFTPYVMPSHDTPHCLAQLYLLHAPVDPW